LVFEIRKSVEESNQAAIEIKDLSKIFKCPLPWLRRLLGRPEREGVLALKSIDLQIRQGEIFGLVGRNGQGKTTLVKTIAGLVEPTAGTVRVHGLDPILRRAEVRRRIGLVTSDERSFYWRLTGTQNLLFFSRLYGFSKTEARERIERLADTFELGDLMGRRFNEFSSGNKQRLAIVRALLTDPQILLLDEPTRSLDPISANNLRRLIVDWVKMSPERTVLITTHNLSEVEELCGRVGILSRNRLVECASLQELRKKYGCQDQVRVHARNVSKDRYLDQLQSEVPEISGKELGADVLEISFPTRNGEPSLNLVLSALIREGAEILECDTQRQGLNGIMVEIERSHGVQG